MSLNVVTLAKADIHIDYDDMYFDKELNSEGETNGEVPSRSDNTHDDDSNSCSGDSDPDNNSGDKMLDDLDNDRYNKYGEYDRGYYYHDRRYERRRSPMMSPIISSVGDLDIMYIKSMVHKKNKRHIQSTPLATSALANKTQSKSVTLENQCDDPREKAYHTLMKELFSMKTFHNAFSQNGLIFKAEYYRNKIDNHIADFIIQIREGKKGWLNHGSVATLHQVAITEGMLNDAENKDPEYMTK
ncbi:hypothetical protein C1645_836602 [Glomus cerebriforme]|uniref:Uncharacterized protein n=1 Tax=Glomus cerebriforme TaxID=658196 RepID=A0A397SGW3_9GLOM|nr:hypothetical protein C1645_836602 [Glomus cerebriforme]